MIIIGLLLVAVAVAVGADVVGQNRVENLQFHAVGHIFTASPGGLIGLGAACGLVGALGIMLLHDGTVRRQRRVLTREAAPVAPAAAPAVPATISGEGSAQVADLRDWPVETPSGPTSRRSIFGRT